MILAKKRKWYYFLISTVVLATVVVVSAAAFYQTNTNQQNGLHASGVNSEEFALAPNSDTTTSNLDNGLTDKNLDLPKPVEKPLPLPPLVLEPEPQTPPEMPAPQPEIEQPLPETPTPVVPPVVMTPTPPVTPPPMRQPIQTNSLSSIARQLEGRLVNSERVVIPMRETIIMPTSGGEISASDKAKITNFITQFGNIINRPGQDLTSSKDALKQLFGVTPEFEQNFEAWFSAANSTMYQTSWGVFNNRIALYDQIQQALRALPEMLAKGMVPIFEWKRPGNVTFTWDFADQSKNAVRNRHIADNKRRVLSNSSEWKRNPKNINDLNYDGWNKSDVTNRFSNFGANAREGISVFAYSPQADNDSVNNQNSKLIAVLDAANRLGYPKFRSFLTQIRASNQKLDGVIIQNMGIIDPNQEFVSILQALPDEIPKVTLFFESNNTQALVGLRNKKISELELFTNRRAIDNAWKINPIDLLGVEFVSTDRNYSPIGDYPPNARVASTIFFNTLTFYEQDDTNAINRGLKFALTDRRDWGVFQGNQGDGGWPTHLDFSAKKNVRSLQGFDLQNLVFYNLNLYNDKDTYTLPLSELASSQFVNLIVKGPRRATLTFSNGTNTKHLYLKGNITDLGADWGKQLQGLLEAGINQFGRKLYVDNQAALELLRNAGAVRMFGYTVEIASASMQQNGVANTQSDVFDIG